MPISNANKSLRLSRMHCSEENTLSLSFDAEAELLSVPADMVFIMDRSSSMRQDGLRFAKEATRKLTENLARASGDPAGMKFKNGSRLALVSFSDDAKLELPLGDDVAALQLKIDALSANGRTNHEAAFRLAQQQLAPSAAARRIIIMMTDGESNIGDATAVSEEIKAMGIEIFCIGLTVKTSVINAWASDPDATHVVSTDDAGQLDRIYNELEKYIVRAGAAGMVIREELEPDFEIVKLNPPSRGVAVKLNPQTVEWKADVVGNAQPERVELSFSIRYTGNSSGVKNVNKSVSYTDADNNVLEFPSPKLTVDCGPDIVVDPCALPVPLVIEGCRDAVKVNTSPILISGLGRIVQVNAEVKNVCPGKRVAVAVMLSELDGNGVEYKRGLKTLLIPAQSGEGCRNVKLSCIDFVVPESLDVSGSTDAICNDRSFNARVFANYVDSDYECCDAQTTIL